MTIKEIHLALDASTLDYNITDEILKLLSSKQEPKTGHWIPKYIAEHPKEFVCDQCGYFVNIKHSNLPFIVSPYEEYKYCPSCGASMKEGD